MLGFLKLTLELLQIEAMLGNLAAGQENHRDIQIVELAQLRIGVDIDLSQSRAESQEQRGHLRFGLLAQVTSRARVERDLQLFRGRSWGRSRSRFRSFRIHADLSSARGAC